MMQSLYIDNKSRQQQRCRGGGDLLTAQNRFMSIFGVQDNLGVKKVFAPSKRRQNVLTALKTFAMVFI
jgi:hypothetical protein